MIDLVDGPTPKPLPEWVPLPGNLSSLWGISTDIMRVDGSTVIRCLAHYDEMPVMAMVVVPPRQYAATTTLEEPGTPRGILGRIWSWLWWGHNAPD